jgi:hypothetical protein
MKASCNIVEREIMKSCLVLALVLAVAFRAFSQMPTRVSGTVHFPSGEPAAGVHVSFNPGIYFGESFETNPIVHEAITDERGRFEIIRPQGRFAYNGVAVLTNCILVRDLERNLTAIKLFPNQGIPNVDLTLQPGIALSGTVQDPMGASVGGADIELDSDGIFFPIRPPFKADALGKFHIPALPRGIEYGISISARGFGSAHGRVEAQNTGTNRYEFPASILKHADSKLAGQVINNDGKPVAGARLMFCGPGQPVVFEGNTDSHGRFFFDRVCEGQLEVSVLLDARMSYPISKHVKAGETNILIALPSRISALEEAMIKGKASDAQSNH